MENETQVFYKRPETNPSVMQSGVQNVPNRPLFSKKPKIERVSTYGLTTLIYAIVSTICLYKNPRGLFFMFFSIATVIFINLSLMKMESCIRKSDWIYTISIVIIGTGMFLTEDKQLTGFGKVMIFILVMIYCLQSLYDESEWQLLKYINAIGFLIGGFVENLGTPFTDFAVFCQKIKKTKYDEEGNPLPKEKSKILYVIIGIAISIPLLIVLIAILCKADVFFKEAVDAILEILNIWDVVGVIVMTIVIYIVSFTLMRFLEMKNIELPNKNTKTHEPILAITVSSLISFVYVLFCLIQIRYLFFGGNELPYNYTYAKYAQEGFYELLAICIINVVLVIVGIQLFKESKVLKILLTLICVCTYIMIASSAYRLYMYVDNYGLTRKRVYAFVVLAVIAVLMVGIIIFIYNDLFQLFKFGLLTVTITTIVLIYIHPTALIAQYNIWKMENGNMECVDVHYLTHELSLDAAPVLLNNYDVLCEIDDEYSMNQMDRYINKFEDDIDEYDSPMKKMNVRTFNVSRYLAKLAYKNYAY